VKRPLVLIATTLVGVTMSACGSDTHAHDGSQTTSSDLGSTARRHESTAPAPSETKADRDKDNDAGIPDDDRNNNATLDYGHAANTTEKREIGALIKRYYAAALTENGAAACPMLYVTIEEAVPEDHGYESAGPAYLSQGKTCPAVMTLLFKHFHNQLKAEVPLLKVARVRIDQHRGLVILSFGKLPERQIRVLREAHTWKLEDLLDEELP
jgi:hypothetical protein